MIIRRNGQWENLGNDKMGQDCAIWLFEFTLYGQDGDANLIHPQ
jgi:hypothetical protein